jgi:hypothetical protein
MSNITVTIDADTELTKYEFREIMKAVEAIYEMRGEVGVYSSVNTEMILSEGEQP